MSGAVSGLPVWGGKASRYGRNRPGSETIALQFGLIREPKPEKSCNFKLFLIIYDQIFFWSSTEKPMKRLAIFILCLFMLSSCGSFGSRMGRGAKGTVESGRAGTYKPGPKFAEHLRDKIAAEYRALEGSNTNIPVDLNEEVKTAIDYLLNDAHRFMIRSLGRSTKYKAMMQAKLRENGLPEDLVWLVLIESGFRTDAVSHASAVGPWQFISATGRRRGLIINDWVDERMHPEKATDAAAKHLKILHGMFGSWNLAAAAYNCGEGKIEKGLKKYDVKTFWELAKQKNYLRDETIDYVPKFLAAMIIAKNPEGFGLTGIEYQKPVRYDEVVMTTPTDLDVIAKLAGTTEKEIRELNPHLKLWCTPVDQKNYPVKIPMGAAANFNRLYAKLSPNERMKVTIHTVHRGESLNKIAGLYKLSPKTLQRYNKLRTSRLKAGQKLKLPVDPKKYKARIKNYRNRLDAERKAAESQGRKIVYKVKSGDTPWHIAQNYDIHWKDIAVWNGIDDARKLQPGDELVLYLDGKGPAKSTVTKKKPTPKAVAAKTKAPAKATASKESGRPATHKVVKGDTIFKVALKYGMKEQELRSLNGLKNNSIRTGQVLKLRSASAKVEKTEPVAKVAAKKTVPAPKKVETKAPAPAKIVPAVAGSGTHTVQANETLWKISQQYKVKPDDIRMLNKLKGDAIRIGQTLKIPGKSGDVTGAPVIKAAAPVTRKVAATAPVRTKTTATAPVRQPAPKKKGATYEVKNGDTLWKIAMLFKMKPEDIKAINGMKDNNIRPGQILKVHNPG